jgi:hypothetical protein
MVLPLALAAEPAPLAAQPTATVAPAAAAPSRIDARDRAEIIAKLGEALRDRYVFPQVGARAAAAIERASAAGAYDGLADPGAFTSRLSLDVGAVAHDKHLKIWSAASPPPPPSAASNALPRAEAGIVRADRLSGGVGYIEVIAFPPQGSFKRVLDKALSSLAGSRALIVDVRRNGGGSPESVAYLVSFLVAPGRPINDIVSRVEKTGEFTRESYRSVATPVSFARTPLYVLTSKGTFSGGEEFAYDIQALGRGTIIGEVTGGGANPVGFVDLGHAVAAMIPLGRAENPVTRTNWEGRGVQPDLRVPANQALAAALKRAGAKPALEIAAASRRQVFAPRSTALPGTELALRKLIAGYASGEPDYAALTPEFAAMTRARLGALKARFSALGELRSMTFRGPDMLGGDEYVLRFANGNRMMAVLLDPAGKILEVSSAMPLP